MKLTKDYSELSFIPFYKGKRRASGEGYFLGEEEGQLISVGDGSWHYFYVREHPAEFGFDFPPGTEWEKIPEAIAHIEAHWARLRKVGGTIGIQVPKINDFWFLKAQKAVLDLGWRGSYVGLDDYSMSPKPTMDFDAFIHANKVSDIKREWTRGEREQLRY